MSYSMDKLVVFLYYILMSNAFAQTCIELKALQRPEIIHSHTGFGQTNYPTNMERCWQLYAGNDTDYVVLLEGHSFHLELGQSCLYDYLAVYDSDTIPFIDSSIGLLGRYCGNRGPDRLYSTQPYMSLIFKSDTSSTDRGFQLAYSRTHKDNVEYPSSSYSTGTIIGFVFMGIVLATIIIPPIVCVVRKKIRKVNPPRNHTTHADASHANAGSVVISTGHGQHPHIHTRAIGPPSYEESAFHSKNPLYIVHQALPPAFSTEQRHRIPYRSPHGHNKATTVAPMSADREYVTINETMSSTDPIWSQNTESGCNEEEQNSNRNSDNRPNIRGIMDAVPMSPPPPYTC